MRLGDILQLKTEPQSLPIIKSFLTQSLSHHDFQAALSRYFEMALALDLHDLVFDEGSHLIKDVMMQTETSYLESILKSMIDASLHLSKFEEARRFIDMRRSILPIIKSYVSTLDDIAYKKALNHPYMDDLEKLTKDVVVPDSIKIEAYYALITYYEQNQVYEQALKCIDILESYDQKNEAIGHEMRILLKLNRVEDAIRIAQHHLKTHPYHHEAIKTLLEGYLAIKDFHKAVTLEAEYETWMDTQDLEFKKDVYPLLIKLYQVMDNKLSLDLYQKKYKSLQKVSDKKIVRPEEDSESSRIIYLERLDEKKEHRPVYKLLDFSFELLQFSHQLNPKLPLRDYFRALFMHTDATIKPKEYIVYLQGETPNLFHYKKERLYDKTLLKNAIENTYLDTVLTTYQDLINPMESTSKLKNILTEKEYDEQIQYVYGFPIDRHAVLLVHYETPPIDPGADYNVLKMMAMAIEGRLKQEISFASIKRENHLLNRILNSPILAYRLIKDHQTTYNTQAMAMFQVDKHQHLELFIRDIAYEDAKPYQEAINRVMAKSGSYEEIHYRYQEKRVYEKMYSLKTGDEGVIMSVFFDQTKDIHQADELKEKATSDYETSLPNLYQLSLDFDEHLANKSSFLLVELNDSIKPIYGTERMTHYFKEFGQITRKCFTDGKTYRFDYHQLMVVLPYNDIRTVTKSIKDYLKMLDQMTSRVLKYEKFNVNIGVLRYPVVTTEKSSDKIFRFLGIALEKAKRNMEEKYVFFVYRDYEDELFEQHVIDQLNVAIEEKALGLVFNQITDIKKNKVWQYESNLIVFNLIIDHQYLIKIARKRNRLIEYERHHIQKVCEFLVDLEKATERLIKLTIPISKETFLDPTFNAYFLGMLKAHGIPGEFIRLKFDMDIRANQYATQIKELIDFGISLDTTSLDTTFSYPFHALHVDFKKDSPKWNHYITHVKGVLDQFQMALVIRNIRTKEQKDLMDSLGIQYLEGPIYKEIAAPQLLQKIKETL